ncbi:DUF3573 domain-containing protein [Francisella noatunensis]|uniref:DUF3573 domain-containing protein n=1 Tax=Francisella noatunensis TaxID=657445 RepID=A0A9Q2KU40_9GAMM|nr:DUF3573 domain-containing protein [Francisella noatunensis]MBK2029411.1 DUF3573 domain-containing protein [Francisella noatunensis]MBK2034031.1 DUF3573 domain-containing protein [Francisella noatunensis]MBK2049377.1 DUF3573 domain-containing protein [Francisella noatunensis]MBK2050826.1 DUF3573 domain-containing protein [Francisella noatunensis]MBK2052248.1 DUF3573 domain-containing protein [Francisella noatunensis]
MVSRLKKTCMLVGSLLACYGYAYSEDSPQVVSQGGPLGATSIGDQSLGQQASQGSANSASSTASSSQQSSGNINERELLLSLQRQVQQLQGQLQQLKSQDGGSLKNTSNGKSSFTTYSSKVDSNQTPAFLDGKGESRDLSRALVSNSNPSDIMQNVSASDSIVNLGDQPDGGIFSSNGGIDVGGGPAITTQGQVTYLGSYSGNNSIPIGQISSNLFASTLLGQREKFDDYSVFFGGFIEADAQAWWGSGISKWDPSNNARLSTDGQNIYLTNAKLFFLSNLGHYVTAQFDFDTDESGSFGLGNAFVIFGNLDTSPFFVTAGRNKLTVGSYGGGGSWTEGITSFLAPGSPTNVSINYKDSVWNAAVAVFGSDDKHANFSTGIFYADSWTPNLAAGLNVGYVYNIAGAQNTSIQDSLTKLKRSGDTVGALNVDGNLAYNIWGGIFQIAAGWASTTNSEEFNGIGTGNVLAGAWYGGLNYGTVLAGRNTTFNVTYGQTYNAKYIPMGTSNASPTFGNAITGIKEQFIISGNRAYFDDNVLFGPEYSYQKLYSGEHMNTITLDMSVYV